MMSLGAAASGDFGPARIFSVACATSAFSKPEADEALPPSEQCFFFNLVSDFLERAGREPEKLTADS